MALSRHDIGELIEALLDYQVTLEKYEEVHSDRYYWMGEQLDKATQRVEDAINRIIDERVMHLVKASAIATDVAIGGDEGDYES